MNGNEAKTSSLYQGKVWRLGLVLAHALPRRLAWQAGWMLGALYGAAKASRREIVVNNLLPVLNNDRAAADQTARVLFREFGAKLADLWRLEAGLRPDAEFTSMTGLEHALAARAGGRGVLLVSFHLGNWELGGPLVAANGLDLTIVTQEEPRAGMTEIRRQSRAQWGIKTVVVGEGGFGFVEIIKRLQGGEVVGLLIDRPPASAGVPVELFGRPFLATIGPAELARATGCAVMATYIVRQKRGYAACILPEYPYARGALGNREARREFMQQIVRSFEPLVRQYAEQWFNFVPVWPAPAGNGERVKGP